MDDRERLFFEHDVATPLSNLKGAEYLLRRGLPDPDPRIRESLEILSGNIHHIERMLSWYWKTHSLRGNLEPVAPWRASDLPGLLEGRLREEGMPLNPPRAAVKLRGWAQVPREPLVVGFIGAAATLASASGQEPSWTLSEVRGVLISACSVPGDASALDPGRLFRKYYWPSNGPVRAHLDAGFPYLEAVLEPFGGNLELAWADGLWTLLATLPLAPRKGGA
jgi:hypothetical protein